MDWLKQNPLFGLALLTCMAALVVEAGLLQRSHRLAMRALADLEQVKQERNRLAGQSPAPSAQNERAVAQDLATAAEMLAGLRTALQGGSGKLLGAPLPAGSTEAYFDIATFVEKTRAIAARARVGLKPDEWFGFASHANEGPEKELIPAVFRQRLAGQYLVEALLESQPQALLAVQRERPLAAVQRTQHNQPAGAGGRAEPGDFFDFDAQFSLRMPGWVDSEAFRLEFTGRTPALRMFLNSLAASNLPVVVRSVEVEPLTTEAMAGGPLPSDTPAPLVAQGFSRFGVIVEFVTLVAAEKEPGA